MYSVSMILGFKRKSKQIIIGLLVSVVCMDDSNRIFLGRYDIHLLNIFLLFYVQNKIFLKLMISLGFATTWSLLFVLAGILMPGGEYGMHLFECHNSILCFSLKVQEWCKI